MKNIPDDIMDVANSVFIRALGRPMDQVICAIAEAIAAERERCAEIADARKKAADKIAAEWVSDERARNIVETRSDEASVIAVKIRRGV